MSRGRRIAIVAVIVVVVASMVLPLVMAPLSSDAAPLPRGATTVTPSAARQNTSGLPPSALVIHGRGNGHGRGMSQWGAFGWATKKGFTWEQIVDFYYGGNGRVVAPHGLASDTVTVRLRTLDGLQTAAVSDTKQATWSGAPGTFGTILARRVGTNRYDVWGSANVTCPAATGTPNGFTQLAAGVPGPIDIATAASSAPTAAAPADLVGVCEPATSSAKSGRIRYYRGIVRAVNDANGAARTVNAVSIESYLRGVVPRESPAGWGDAASGAGMHALRSQAIGARSYALSESRYSFAKTCDNQDCQVYGGAALRNVGSATASVLEDRRTDTAIAETATFVVKDSAGRLVRTEYTSSNGGRTAGGTFPAKIDEGDLAADAAQQMWTRLFSAADVQKKYPTIGIFMSAVTTHDGLGGDWNGYATSVTITGTAGRIVRTGPQFRSDFGLPNHWFETTLVEPAPATAPPVGQVLLVGDSVSESIANEFASVVTPAYPQMNFHACAGRGMAGTDCQFTVTAPQLDLDGVGVVNATETPAVAIVALGYNDDPAAFAGELQQMLSALATKGVQRTILVNLSTRNTTRNYTLTNQAMAVAAASNPQISVVDWNAASADPARWRWFENSSLCCWVHLSQSGRAEFALFLRRQLDTLREQGLLPVAAPSAPVILGLPMKRGNTGTVVSVVQKRLNTSLGLKGKKRIATDGVFGVGTARTVKDFQAKAGLPATGVVDRATWDALGLANRSDLAVLRLGTKHPSVATVQTALAKVLKKKIAATGVYDRTLVNHVKTLQKNLGMKQSGRVGPQTWMLLTAAAARP